MDAFEALQSRLREVWEANRPGSTTPHVVVGLPSFDLSESILAHYAERIASLEHRYLHASLLLRSIPACEFIHVTCQHPGQEVLEYYAHLGSPDDPAAFRKRVTVFEVPDLTPRSIATKLLERPDLIAALRDTIGGRLAMLEPWNVTEPVVDLALQLGTPVNGSSPDLWPLGFKSAGRQLIQRAGVPTPLGREGVHTLDDVARAIDEIRQARPLATALVLKTDNSGAGDGNRTVPLNGPDGRPRPLGEIRHSLERLPAWYLQDLRAGGVVEELIGQAPASPSVQVDINPDHSVTVLSTHEQVLGGEGGQVYEGCSFPANPAYAVQLAEYGRAVGEELAKAGAVGRFALDFVAEQGESGWRLYALEVNLRKGGTTHPYTALRHLIRGRYEPEQGWVRKEGDTRCYRSTDNLVDPEWQRLSPAAVIEAIERARLSFDHATGTGVVLHMLSGLAVDGRLGLTAFGVSPEQCDLLHESAREAIGLVAALA